MRILLPLVFIFGLVSPANAINTCGELADFYLECAKARGSGDPIFVESGFFAGYVSGVVDGNWTLFAIPSNATNGQIGHVVGRWLRRNPQEWHKHKFSCVIQALQETWPKN